MKRHRLIIPVAGLLWACAAVLGQPTEPAGSASVGGAPQAARPGSDQFLGYDFEQIVRRVETSVDPLQQEMSGSLKDFAQGVEQAQALIEQGKSRQAMDTCSAAMDKVLVGRDRVLTPMWEGQTYLNDQMANVRARLAKAVEAAGGTAQVKLDSSTQTLLDGVAKRIAAEKDEGRKKRLIGHYKAVRQLATIKQMAQQLSPNQRKLWRNVLGVLENTTSTHQQVLMRTEVLYAQFETVAANLKEYKGLIDTVEGASRLLSLVKGLGESGQGLAQFSQGMTDLQDRMAGFNTQVEELLQDKMLDLESQAQSVTETMAEGAAADAVGSSQIDDELAQRIGRINGKAQSPAQSTERKVTQ